MSTLVASLMLLFGILAVLAFNVLVRRRNAVENAFAGIDVHLALRHDLIPNLVEAVRGYAQHERETLRQVTELRAQAADEALPSDRRIQAANRIGEGMRRLMALAEAYPDLKASEQFQQLQRALNEVEERLSASRRAFNAAVLDYNNLVDQFPTNLLAGAMGFRRRAFFDAPESTRAPVNARV